MLRTRVLVGSLLAVLILGVLLLDDRFAPWYPVLFATLGFLGLLGTIELLRLIPDGRRPPTGLCLAGVLAVLLVNWLRPFAVESDPWHLAMAIVAAVLIGAFLFEMARFREPGE